jgi:hypothetical protein
MTLADDTRAAAREHPFLVAALRARVLNYAAAARFLDVGETDAVATALRRYGEELSDYAPESRSARVTMHGGVGPVDPGEALLAVGDLFLAPDGGDLTAVVAAGDVDAAALGAVLSRLAVVDVSVEAAGVGAETLVVVVEKRAGPDAVRAVESALGAVRPTQ